MLKSQSKSRKVGLVSFCCPLCGRLHRVNLYQMVEDEGPDDFGDVLVGPPSNGLTCKCGAELLVLGDPEDFDVIWFNEKEMIRAAWLKTKPFLRPGQGLYYDLVRVPHGHVPVGKVWLWSRFPLIVKEFRGNTYFKCPECGLPSFFKSDICCRNCAANGKSSWFVGENILRRWQNRDRRDYFRKFLKDLEVLVLPVLALMGKAWYVRSERRHCSDYQYDFLKCNRYAYRKIQRWLS